MRRLHGLYQSIGLKEHGEHLTPLTRFLLTAVGRRWNDVWKELTESLDSRSTVQRHVLFHVMALVHQHVIVVNGVPCEPLTHRDPPAELFSATFYVDPRGGLLQRHVRRGRS